MFDKGFLNLGTFRGALVRLHWSIPLGAFVFGHFEIAPFFWLGFLGLLVAHELGHAWLVKRLGLRVLALELHAMGGECIWDGYVTPLQRSVIAWGGVVGQLLVLLGAVLANRIWGPPASGAALQLQDVLVRTNIILIAINLLPVPPLDGANAWRLLSMWRRRPRKRTDPVEFRSGRQDEIERAAQAAADVQEQLDAIARKVARDLEDEQESTSETEDE